MHLFPIMLIDWLFLWQFLVQAALAYLFIYMGTYNCTDIMKTCMQM